MPLCFLSQLSSDSTRPTGIIPDIQTIAKGLSGGYQALSAVLMQERVVEVFRQGSGIFANGHTFQSHPAAAAAGLAVLKVFESDNVVANCAARGQEVTSDGSDPLTPTY